MKDDLKIFQEYVYDSDGPFENLDANMMDPNQIDNDKIIYHITFSKRSTGKVKNLKLICVRIEE